MGMPRIGMGGGGWGGGRGGMGGGRGRGGMQQQQVKGTVRWESAKPVQEALKSTLPESFANRYVISVSGLPMMQGGRDRSEDDNNSGSNQPSQDMLDRLKSVTNLAPKDKRGAQPGVIEQQPSYGSPSILFGFSKEMLDLSKDEKEVLFTTQLGRIEVKAKFNLKDMLYHGELAV